MRGPVLFCRLGTVDYAEAHRLQKELQAKRIAGKIGDTVLLLEHPAVLTMGRSAKEQHVLAPPEVLEARGISVHDVGRGGDVTYHGPGQLVAYPIIDLKPDRRDVRKYMWSLEETMIRTCSDFGLSATRVEGLNGAWIGERKVGAVGVRISRWVTMHGLALNANSDLTHFDLIVPCGIQDKVVTSLSAELGRTVGVADVIVPLATHFAGLYDTDVEWQDTLPGGLSL
ncbi:MAG: lipoyl(octanoyl) transferase LipB [Deltaproteobacteria bacterium]|nr:lipoyl(octanoyl) transferase LipB [Deltaproteobacteria bacterium]MBW1874996.1 lipoyl(octanoyl) transferase LipB [Deltaproteobacteria bacterium]MBW2211354.1 lipoyl(octanoyl) transferase LipB [Deltaproteobacteria bacterium]MBW2215122.1 lipoyl(octanoyl) transferase LipB [Deltaproteobacteria bacterium]MBW2379918.1 lipoyl(octanoyl) transferase LipB [Deltaproteobacteria bacterium]